MINTIKRLLGIGPNIDIRELVNQGAIIVDLRSKGEFNTGHVKGSVNIPLDQLKSNLKKFKDKEQVIITCCASGMRSASAKGILKSEGFVNTHNGGSWYKVQNSIG